MRETLQIRRGKSESKSSSNAMVSLNAELSGKRSLLPTVDIGDTISLNDLFMDERAASEKYRIVVEMAPVISNSLFNNVTEVVGVVDGKVVSLNYEEKVIQNAHNKSFPISAYEAVRDTQFSSEELGFKYYCGRDIFNNHILRNKSFKSVCKYSGSTGSNANFPPFNTIEDFLRLPDGEVVKNHKIAYGYFSDGRINIDIDSHLYEIKDVYPFAESLENLLIEKDGWFGFDNKQTINVFDENDECLDIHRVINSEPAGSFVTMYPGKKEYSMIPQYNDFNGLLEDNWKYCITYPSSSTTENIFFIYNDGLCVREIYDGEKRTDGTYSIELSSYSMHGLIDGDVVNVYRVDLDDPDAYSEMVIESEEVSVLDDYTFSVTSRNFDDGISAAAEDGNSETDEPDIRSYLYYFKRVVNGIENKYYVRIFSRLPNFKFADKEVSPQTLYSDGSNLIDRYQGEENDFEKHVSSMGFSQTIYGDKTCQIVFTDDIDISYLRDNLGRPLTDIYLTVIKNNSGYREWYKNWNGEDLKDIERSHCFGKLTCGFVLNEGVVFGDCNKNLSNALYLNNIDESMVSGLTTEALNVHENDEIEKDEISYMTDKHFYGDLCTYSPYEQMEDVIEPIMFRFTTAQRELNSGDTSYSAFSSVAYDEILVDDNLNVSKYVTDEDKQKYSTPTGFIAEKRVVSGGTVCRRNEGYIYNPHFKINLRHPSIEQKVSNSFTFRCMYIKEVSDGKYEVYTEFPNYGHLGEEVIFFNAENYTETRGKILSIVDGKKFVCSADFPEEPDVKEIILVRRPEDIPMYAEFLTDGSCSFTWRDIVRNGDENDVTNDEYPFANGRHYVTKKFNLFLKRQDPLMETGLQTIPDNEAFRDPFGKRARQDDYVDTYYKEKDSEC